MSRGENGICLKWVIRESTLQQHVAHPAVLTNTNRFLLLFFNNFSFGNWRNHACLSLEGEVWDNYLSCLSFLTARFLKL